MLSRPLLIQKVSNPSPSLQKIWERNLLNTVLQTLLREKIACGPIAQETASDHADCVLFKYLKQAFKALNIAYV